MSGVEAAGFILAAIPLVISFVEHYADGVRTINRWRKYDRELKSLCRRLRSEEELFRNTCELLLRDIVTSEQELETLVVNPAGPAWSDSHLESRLQSKLSRSYVVYMEVVEDMKEAVNAIKDRMGIKDDVKKAAGASTSFFQKGKFTMTRKGFDDLMERMRRDNDTLDRLVNQSNELEPSRRERRRRKEAQFFKHVRQCAAAMFDAVSTALSCTCPETHTLSLSLSSRKTRVGFGKHNRDEQDLDFPVIISHAKSLKGKSALLWSEINFRLVAQEDDEADINLKVVSSTSETKQGKFRSVSFAGFATPTDVRVPGSHTSAQAKVGAPKFRHTDSDQTSLSSQIRILSSQTSNLTVSSTSTQQILDLCQTLRNLDTTKPIDCLGLLDAQSNSFQIRPLLTAHDVDDFDSCFVSLHTVLYRRETSLPDLYRADKLRIAVAIASSVLQLYDSKWLESDWSKNNVFFVRRRTRDLFEQAFVSRPLPPKHETNATGDLIKAPPMPYIRNGTLFALGILLIELCLGKTIEQLRLPDDLLLGKATPDALANLSTAGRLLRNGQLSKEASLRYQSAISRCIYCNFDQESVSLENDQFRQAVYDGVVAPIEQDLAAFEGPLGV